MRYFLFAALCFCGVWVSAQTRQQMNDTIPFEIVQGKLIFGASINGNPVKLILDTGGQNIIVADSAKKFETEFVRNHTVADVNDTRIETWIGKVKNFKVGSFWGWGVKEVVVVPNNPFFRELGVVGAVSGEMFREAVLTIDRRARHFVISYPYRPSGIKRDAGLAVDFGTIYHPVVPVKFGEQELNVLFDSGASGFLSLGDGDYQKIKGETRIEAEGYGLLFVGAAGIEGALVDSIYKVNVPLVTLPGDKVLENVGVLVGGHSTTIAGQQILDMGRLMLDFPRRLFYFFPYEDGATDVREITQTWNVKILPMVEDGKGIFRVVATVGETGVENRERVWSVEGVDLSTVALSEDSVVHILEGKDSAVMTVGDDRREVEIRKI